MAEYWLPDPSRIPNLPCPYETRLLGPADFAPLYRPEWSNALCEKRKHLDELGVGAYDRGKLVGLAGCSADCAGMWQIGIDVLPEYRLAGHCQRPDQHAGPGNSGPGQSPLLLLRLGQPKIRAQRPEKRLLPRLGGDDRQAAGNHQRPEPATPRWPTLRRKGASR